MTDDEQTLNHYARLGLRHGTAVATLMHQGDPEEVMDYLDGLSQLELRITCTGLASTLLRVLHAGDVDVDEWLRTNALDVERLL